MNFNDRNKKIATVRPSPLASKFGIVILLVFLVFGECLVLGVGVRNTDSSEPGHFIFAGFGLLWFVMCVGGIIYNAMNLSTYSKEKKNSFPVTAGEVFEMTSEPAPNEPSSASQAGASHRSGGGAGGSGSVGPDFETRLRKLESLKKDGLITEDEYRRKREEILNDKW